jgi:hypothetical protein
MATHKQTIRKVKDFLIFSERYRAKKLVNKITDKDETKWLQLYNEMLKVINEYDVDKINYKTGRKS